MAVTVSLNPNVSSYTLGDAPLGVTMSGGALPNFLWEGSGIFVNRFDNPTTFTPANITGVNVIYGRSVTRQIEGGDAAIAAYGSYGLYKNSGDSGWNCYAYLASASLMGTHVAVFHFSPLDTSHELAAGYLTNGAYKNPESVGGLGSSFEFNWHLYDNGTAVPRRMGTVLSRPILYKAGDDFKIRVSTTKIYYYHNNKLIARGDAAGAAYIYGAVSFNTGYGAVTNYSHMQSEVDNQGFITVSVTGVFPVQPNYQYDLASDSIVVSSTNEDGSLMFRKRGNIKRTLGLQFKERSFAEYVLIDKFWKAHDKDLPFLYRDLVTNESYMTTFETGPRHTVLSPDVVTIQVGLKEI